MAPINNEASVLSLRIEATEGTPLLATASGDFVSLQPGFEFTPESDNLENVEIRSTIAKAASRPGIQRVNAKLDHYIRHSGVEGQEPDWAVLLESVLGGKDIEATEYDVTGGSTTKVLVMPTGEGANFREGQGLLIKDPVNGRSIRNVKSISGDSLTLNFALAVAPLTGVNLGKCVGYYGVDTGHKSLTGDLFRGQGGDREVAAGLKCSEMAISVVAAEYVNGSFTLVGTKYHFDAIEITASSKYLDINDGTSDFSVSVAVKVYRDPYELAEALQSALNDAGTARIFTVTWNDYGTNAGKFTIAANGTFNIEWNTGANTANTIGTKLGFLVAADDTGAATYTSDNVQDWSTGVITPSYDSKDPDVAVSAELLVGDATETHNVCATEMKITAANDVVERKCISAETGIDSIGIRRRTVTWEITARLEKHEARYFKKFRANDDLSLMFNYGEKTGGNFVQGKSMNLYTPTGKITAINVTDTDGDATLVMTVQAYAQAGKTREFFVNGL